MISCEFWPSRAGSLVGGQQLIGAPLTSTSMGAGADWSAAHRLASSASLFPSARRPNHVPLGQFSRGPLDGAGSGASHAAAGRCVGWSRLRLQRGAFASEFEFAADGGERGGGHLWPDMSGLINLFLILCSRKWASPPLLSSNWKAAQLDAGGAIQFAAASPSSWMQAREMDASSRDKRPR